MTKRRRRPSKADPVQHLGRAVARVVAAAMLTRAVADHVPTGGDGDKLDRLDAIELWLLHPAVAELQEAHEMTSADLSG